MKAKPPEFSTDVLFIKSVSDSAYRLSSCEATTDPAIFIRMFYVELTVIRFEPGTKRLNHRDRYPVYEEEQSLLLWQTPDRKVPLTINGI